MPDYSNACIYKIKCKDPLITEFYIGSTRNFKQRGYQHKANSKKSNFKVYEFIRSNGGWDNFDMKLIRDKLGVNNRTDLITIEGQYQKLLKPALNKCIAGRTEKEYKEEWNQNNKEYYKEYMKEYANKNKEKIKEYKKEYRQNNKEYYKEYMKEYAKKNREKKLKRRRELYALKKLAQKS